MAHARRALVTSTLLALTSCGASGRADLASLVDSVVPPAPDHFLETTDPPVLAAPAIEVEADPVVGEPGLALMELGSTPSPEAPSERELIAAPPTILLREL